jgi:hypothetical protein
VAECPMANAAGPVLELRMAQAAERMASWEAEYPTAEYGRKYVPGTPSDTREIHCEGNEETKYCNKVMCLVCCVLCAVLVVLRFSLTQHCCVLNTHI